MQENQSKAFHPLKIKVVLDTNIIISAAISTNGKPAQIFEMLIREEIQNFTSSEIIEEIEDVIARPKIAKYLSLVEQEFIVNTFTRFSENVKPKISLKEVKDDHDDDKFLECAVTANVDYIISGDPHLLNLKQFRGIKIISPAEFLSQHIL
tara:strand:- start:881 stop:1333 length:453 start_codon:yes stop_codon:yes gene_type:complete